MPTPSVSIPPYRVVVRNSAMVPIGELGRMTGLKLIPRFNDVGAFEISLPMGHSKTALIAQGGWLEFLSNDNTVMAGNIRGIRVVEDESNVGGTLTAYGPSAEQVIADRLAYQVPGSAATSQASDDYDNRSGFAETIIKQYVNLNAGPGALAARQTTGLIMETDLARGTSVKASARMTNLLELCQGIGTAGGVGFRVVFVGNQLEFRVYVPTDKSGSAKFGSDLGNLISYEYTREASKSSCVVVGGGGDGTARTFREINDTTAQADWFNRSETFIDKRDTTDIAELDQAATQETVDSGPVKGLSIKTADTPNLQFNREYFLGDRVSVPQAGITDVLREVEIEWTADKGPSTSSTVGTATTTGTLKMLKLLEDVNLRVADLESRK